MADTKTILEQAYSAFNDRDIDGALALMTKDVNWPKASEGGKVVGKEEMKTTNPARPPEHHKTGCPIFATASSSLRWAFAKRTVSIKTAPSLSTVVENAVVEMKCHSAIPTPECHDAAAIAARFARAAPTPTQRPPARLPEQR